MNEMEITEEEVNRWLSDRVAKRLIEKLEEERTDFEQATLNLSKGGDELTIEYHTNRGTIRALDLVIGALNSPYWCIS